MSLIPLALRIITVRALQNSTLAGACVFDSAIDPIDQRIKQEAQPVILVYTDDDKQTVAGRDLLNASRELQLTLEFAAATAVSVKVKVEKENGEEGEEELVSYEIPHTDAGLEATLNLIRRQTFRVLLSDQGKWPAFGGNLPCRLVLCFRGAERARKKAFATQRNSRLLRLKRYQSRSSDSRSKVRGLNCSPPLKTTPIRGYKSLRKSFGTKLKCPIFQRGAVLWLRSV